MTRTMNLTIPVTATVAITAEIRAFGQRHRETGGFLLTPPGNAAVSVVALAGVVGIIRHRNLFEISSRALARLFMYADDHDLRVPVQFHSHETLAFLSRTDADHGLCVEGFTSVVIPRFADPPNDPAAWGWWTFHSGAWGTTTPAQPSAGVTQLIRFDEDGIHAP